MRSRPPTSSQPISIHPHEARTREQRSLHDVLEKLGVHLDARHVITHRRRQMIRQPERGHADEHQAALEEARIRLARKHVGGRHEAIGIVPGVVDPRAAVRVAGSDEGAHPHRLDARGRDAHRDRRPAFPQAEHLEAQRRHQPLGHHGQQGHPADHSPLQVHAGQAVAEGGAVDLIHAVQGGLEASEEGRRIAADRAHRRVTDLGRRFRRPALEARDAEHHRLPAHRLGQDRVVPAQPREPLRHVRVQSGHHLGQPGRRETVGLGHEDGQADGGRPRGRHRPHDSRQPGSGPRPLPMQAQAFLVDGDDDHRGHARDSRVETLIGIERARAQQAQPGQLRQQEPEQERGQQQGAGRPAAPAQDRAGPPALRPVRGIGPVPPRGRLDAQAALLRAPAPGRRRRPRPRRDDPSA